MERQVRGWEHYLSPRGMWMHTSTSQAHHPAFWFCGARSWQPRIMVTLLSIPSTPFFHSPLSINHMAGSCGALRHEETPQCGQRRSIAVLTRPPNGKAKGPFDNSSQRHTAVCDVGEAWHLVSSPALPNVFNLAGKVWWSEKARFFPGRYGV